MNLIECLQVFKDSFKVSSQKAFRWKAIFAFLVCLASFPLSAQENSEPSLEGTPAAAAESQTIPTPEETPLPPGEPAPVAASPTPAMAATPAAVTAAANKKALKNLKTVRDETYNKPVYFESMDNLLPTMEFEYDLTEKDGKVLRVGDLTIDDQNFFFAMVPVSKLHSKMSSAVEAEVAAKPVMVLRWPEPLQEGGTLEAIARTGAVLWKEEITPEKREAWQKQLDAWKKALEDKGVKMGKPGKTSVFASQYGILDVGATGLKPYNESIRFCLTQTQGRARSRLCSQRYVIRGNEKQMTLSKVATKVIPRVLFQNKNAPLKQVSPVPRDMPTMFFAELAGGESYEFLAIPNKLNLMDLTDTKNPDQMRIVAWGMRPTTPSTILNPDVYSYLTRLLGFEATIGDMRKFWEANISVEDPKIYLPGQGGGVFTQRFELSEIPRSNARPYLELHTPAGTYENGVKLFGKKAADVKITSFENSVEVDNEDPTHFTWRFKATEKGEINRSYLSMEYQGKEYKAFYELYKGSPREVSLRLSGLLSADGKNVFLGEGAYNQWFEDFLGWTNYWVGRQRWGISVRYFKTLTKLAITGAGNADLAVTNADLKYRFTPGLWGREETVGAMIDYQDVSLSVFKAPMIGFGGFWGRSMPKVFDNIFNIVPWMRYPKWVDMEFIYYPISLSTKSKLETNIALNFHGKVLWSKHWFGEAGFGLKRYAIVESAAQRITLNTFYGTVGLGLSF